MLGWRFTPVIFASGAPGGEDAPVTGEPPPPSRQPVRWHLVVPVKHADQAKTRLEPPHPLSRPALARAVAADTLREVCRALPPAQVTVVTSDPAARETARRLGARVVPDPGAGLNAAVAAGWAGGPVETPDETGGTVTPDGMGGAGTSRAARTRATPPRVARTRPGWAALLGDLPALRSEDLREALERCSAEHSAVVPDADGTGTVLLTSTVAPPTPRFGPGSAARHAEDATLLELDLPRLRRDVDTVADLALALALGVGPATSAVLGAPAQTSG